MTPPDTATSDGGDLFDLGQGKLWLGFVFRSLRRHKLRAILTFVVLASLTSFVALAGGKEFATGTQLTARNDSVLNGLLIGGSASTERPEPPATLAESTIKSQKNLERIIRDLGLVESYHRNDGKLAKVKDKILGRIFGGGDTTIKHEDIVDLLRAKIVVSTETTELVKQTINVVVTWIDPAIARQIATEVNANFLSDRHTAEVGPIEDSLGIARQEIADQDAKVRQLRFDLNIPENDRRLLPESSPLKPALAIQSSLAQRLVDLRLQLENTQKAFAYRYSVVTPPALPKAPVSGRLSSLILGLLASAIVATFVTTATDVLRGRIVEPWQVARKMNLPLLAELPS